MMWWRLAIVQPWRMNWQHLLFTDQKRATASLLRDYEGEPTTVPVIGGYAVVVNAGGDPTLRFSND